MKTAVLSSCVSVDDNMRTQHADIRGHGPEVSFSPRFAHLNFKWQAAALYCCHLTAEATYGKQLCSSRSHHKTAILFLALASESASVCCQLGDTPPETGK